MNKEKRCIVAEQHGGACTAQALAKVSKFTHLLILYYFYFNSLLKKKIWEASGRVLVAQAVNLTEYGELIEDMMTDAREFDSRSIGRIIIHRLEKTCCGDMVFCLHCNAAKDFQLTYNLHRPKNDISFLPV